MGTIVIEDRPEAVWSTIRKNLQSETPSVSIHCSTVATPEGSIIYLTSRYAIFGLIALSTIDRFKVAAQQLLESRKSEISSAFSGFSSAPTLSVPQGFHIRIPESYELAVEHLRAYYHLLPIVGTPNGFTDYILMCAMVAWNKCLFNRVLSWGMSHGHSIVTNNVNSFLVDYPENGHPSAATTPMSPATTVALCYLTQAVLFKNLEYLQNWSQKRIKSLFVMLNIHEIEPSTGILGEQALKNWGAKLCNETALLEVLIEYNLAAVGSGSTTLSGMSQAILMLAKSSYMANVLNAYAYVTERNSKALYDGTVAAEALLLARNIRYLKAQHGNRFEYCRALKLPGHEKLDITQYRNVVYCAHVRKEQSERTWSQVKCPEPTLTKDYLKSLALTPIQDRQDLGPNSQEYRELVAFLTGEVHPDEEAEVIEEASPPPSTSHSGSRKRHRDSSEPGRSVRRR